VEGGGKKGRKARGQKEWIFTIATSTLIVKLDVEEGDVLSSLLVNSRVSTYTKILLKKYPKNVCTITNDYIA
jgi:hypothetical protein